MLHFEGTEKTIEIGLSNKIPMLRRQDATWESIMNSCGAHILSKSTSPQLDAFILSESSLFIRDNYIYAITCGTTELLNILEPIFDRIPIELVSFFRYSRKNFRFPLDQESNFEVESKQPASFFPGKSYCLGPQNGDHYHVFQWSSKETNFPHSTSIKILMDDIDPRIGRLFCFQNVKNAAEAEYKSGLKQLFPADACIDRYFFSPTGYSTNVIFQDCYYTVHVTPQSNCSYASFEACVPGKDFAALTQDAVSIFKPKSFCIVTQEKTHHDQQSFFRAFVIPGYASLETSMRLLPHNWKLVFTSYGESGDTQ